MQALQQWPVDRAIWVIRRHLWAGPVDHDLDAAVIEDWEHRAKRGGVWEAMDHQRQPARHKRFGIARAEERDLLLLHRQRQVEIELRSSGRIHEPALRISRSAE